MCPNKRCTLNYFTTQFKSVAVGLFLHLISYKLVDLQNKINQLEHYLFTYVHEINCTDNSATPAQTPMRRLSWDCTIFCGDIGVFGNEKINTFK